MERDPSLARVTFDVPREHMPALLATLGTFALEHDLGITIENAPEGVTRPGLSAEIPAYDSPFVSLLPDEGDQLAAVVTRKSLLDFAKEYDLSTNSASSLLRRLGNEAADDANVRAMLYGTPGARTYIVNGLRVAELWRLKLGLVNETISLPQVGKSAADLIVALHKHLFPEDQPANRPAGASEL